mgnify:CR=1 FL=1
MPRRERYAIIGTGSRSGLYQRGLLADFAESCELAALVDTNATRMAYWNRHFGVELGTDPVPAFRPDELEAVIRDRGIDRVVVTTPDSTHDEYIARSLDAGCGVVCEKPVATDADRLARIFDAVERTGGEVRVAHNYRYAPRHAQVRALLADGVIGEVTSVHFEWLLDTCHGADYFRRWHRDRRRSGTLLVHKACHHFDLVRWWIEADPANVYAAAGLRYYGRENAERQGNARGYERSTGAPGAEHDPFALQMDRDERLRGLYLDAEHEDGYIRDRCVFGDGITIDDDMAAIVRYTSGATMTYRLTAYAPWEGYRVAFNGTRGRLEYEVEERSYVSGSWTDHNSESAIDPSRGEIEIAEPIRLLVRPTWGRPRRIEVDAGRGEGGHGGGDRRLLRDLFGAPGQTPRGDPLRQAATHVDGAWAVLTGAAAVRSAQTGGQVEIADLFDLSRLAPPPRADGPGPGARAQPAPASSSTESRQRCTAP